MQGLVGRQPAYGDVRLCFLTSSQAIPATCARAA